MREIDYIVSRAARFDGRVVTLGQLVYFSTDSGDDVDGLIVDARTAPRGIQEEAYRLGLIPFLPGQPAPADDATKAGLMASRLEEIAGWCAHSAALDSATPHRAAL